MGKALNYHAHFKKVDPKIFGLALKYKLEEIVDTGNYFEKLCDTIIGQQLSGRVADVIFARFKALFPKGKVTAKGVLKLKDLQIREIGASNSKVAFIKDLAAKVQSGEITFEGLGNLTNEEIAKMLTSVHGIGPWTVEMFLMFCLGRPDVFSTGDLGLLRAIEKLYDLDSPSKSQMADLSLIWSPYRTYAARLLWKSLDNR
ncbi:DNA-3-methyladenine glycosylase 2 family protein [Candidatus Curtissbacteria bacterium]|nr:DNA-3-methyladenine glycosylase 2 family protein [Candidatus Curtissbacteria bacterium]